MTRSETVLVVAAHPADESLGCGGTIARHAAAGDSVHVLFIADGVTARSDTPRAQPAADAASLQDRREACHRALALLGSERPAFLDLPDNRLDTIPLLDIVQAIEGYAREQSPTVVYTHHAGDLNVDHRLVCQAVVTAFRPLPGETVRAIYGFEVASSTEWAYASTGADFRPTRTVDISSTLQKKLDALTCYASEMREFPHARSIAAVEALARWRGAAAGVDAGEAFMVIREVVR